MQRIRNSERRVLELPRRMAPRHAHTAVNVARMRWKWSGAVGVLKKTCDKLPGLLALTGRAGAISAKASVTTGHAKRCSAVSADALHSARGGTAGAWGAAWSRWLVICPFKWRGARCQRWDCDSFLGRVRKPWRKSWRSQPRAAARSARYARHLGSSCLRSWWYSVDSMEGSSRSSEARRKGDGRARSYASSGDWPTELTKNERAQSQE